MVKTKKNNLSLQPYTPATGSVPASHKNLLRMYYQVSLEDKHSGESTEVFFCENEKSLCRRRLGAASMTSPSVTRLVDTPIGAEVPMFFSQRLIRRELFLVEIFGWHM